LGLQTERQKILDRMVVDIPHKSECQIARRRVFLSFLFTRQN